VNALIFSGYYGQIFYSAIILGASMEIAMDMIFKNPRLIFLEKGLSYLFEVTPTNGLFVS